MMIRKHLALIILCFLGIISCFVPFAESFLYFFGGHSTKILMETWLGWIIFATYLTVGFNLLNVPGNGKMNQLLLNISSILLFVSIVVFVLSMVGSMITLTILWAESLYILLNLVATLIFVVRKMKD